MKADNGDKVRVETEGMQYEGILMPSQTGKIVLKIKNGYNIGIKPDSASIILLEQMDKMDYLFLLLLELKLLIEGLRRLLLLK